MPTNVDKLLNKVDSKFTLVILSAKRARQVNDYFNAVKRHELLNVRPPEIEAVSNKPLSVALQEIQEEKITYERPEGTPIL